MIHAYPHWGFKNSAQRYKYRHHFDTVHEVEIGSSTKVVVTYRCGKHSASDHVMLAFRQNDIPDRILKRTIVCPTCQKRGEEMPYRQRDELLSHVLTEEEVEDLVSKRNAGWTLRMLAKEFDVHLNTVRNILRRVTNATDRS